VQGYLSLIQQGRYQEALDLNRQVNPLPLTVGRVCTHPCESNCHRGTVDEPLAICSLKRFLGDEELAHPPARQAQTATSGRRKVAVVGSGPAGLAAARDLAGLGYAVTIFEAQPAAGGMLAWGIPRFRLPLKVVEADLAWITAQGVEIRTGSPIGEPLSIDALQADGCEAVLLAIGAQRPRGLGIPGEEGAGVIDCLSLMKKVNLGERPFLGENVVVVGGGNVATDGARTALRLGARKVTMVCLEARAKMPAGHEELKAAEEEGVAVLDSRQCLRVIRANGRITGVECVRLESMRFEKGRLYTHPIGRSEHVVTADAVVLAVGQVPDVSGLAGLPASDVSASGQIVVDPVTRSTRRPGLFAAGDAVSGPSTVIEAIASGKRAAQGIHAYLQNGTLEMMPPVVVPATEVDLVWGDISRRPRLATRMAEAASRLGGFEEVDSGYDRAAAKAEAGRCLACGVFSRVDFNACCGKTCRLCMDNCWQMAITLAGTTRAW
jgi:NADH-quinone oxidoreductase subunit F